jgi:hypothetical protein
MECGASGCDTRIFGMWRSLVAHLTGGQGVAGSNPVIPTNKNGAQSRYAVGPFSCLVGLCS